MKELIFLKSYDESNKKDINFYLEQLKKEKISLNALPIELFSSNLFFSYLNKNDYVTLKSIGFDSLKQKFFADVVLKKPGSLNFRDFTTYKIVFDIFDDYYNYLGGNIYDNSTYIGFEFNENLINKYNLDISKLNVVPVESTTMDDFKLEYSEEEIKEYEDAEKVKNLRLKWLEKISATKKQSEFNDTFNKLKRSPCYNEKFFLSYIIGRFNAIYSKYLVKYTYLPRDYIFAILYRFGMDFLDDKIDAKELKKYKEKYNDICVKYLNEHETHYYKGFDKDFHLFYVSNRIGMFVQYDLFFKDFDEFIIYLKKDLSDCDLSSFMNNGIKFDKYTINKDTILPIDLNIDYSKGYIKKYNANKKCFEVKQVFLDLNRNVVKSKIITFDLFDSFLKYVNYDLTNADLLECDDLINVPNLDKYNIGKAKVKSEILDKYNIDYNHINLNQIEFDTSVQCNNEVLSIDNYNSNRNLVTAEDDSNDKKVFYISDLHLEHRLINAHAKNEADIIYELNKIAKEITNHEGFIIVAGDVSHDISLYKKFIEILSKNKRKSLFFDQEIIFTLGNHELWSFANTDIDVIVEGYRKLLSQYGFYLLHNEILCFNGDKPKYYSKDIILSNEFDLVVKNEINSSNVKLFGGIGFAGNNETFNANNGIYNFVINREDEVNYSKEFEYLYNKVIDAMTGQTLIVVSHMPLSDWTNQEYKSNFIYISGHSHKNFYYDDSDVRVYADNQVGYKGKEFSMKYFYLDDTYDKFKYYDDGIHNISADEYRDFYRGIKKYINFNKKDAELYMIKKNGYYMFVRKYEKSLCILNGGAEKKLPIRDMNYYFDNIEKEVELVKSPLDEYTKVQKTVSEIVKQFGGSGNIHGAIVDISFFTHIYVNPYDLKLTYYYAVDKVDKTVYKNLSTLLKDHESVLFLNYQKLIESKNKSALEIFKKVDEKYGKSAKYYSTDIYSASLKLNQMQKLFNKIIAVWIDLDSNKEQKLLLNDVKEVKEKATIKKEESFTNPKVFKECNQNKLSEFNAKINLINPNITVYYFDSLSKPVFAKCNICGFKILKTGSALIDKCHCPVCDNKRFKNVEGYEFKFTKDGIVPSAATTDVFWFMLSGYSNKFLCIFKDGVLLENESFILFTDRVDVDKQIRRRFKDSTYKNYSILKEFDFPDYIK